MSTNEKVPKNIVICCDGTGNQYGVNNTNVVLTYENILKSRSTQLLFYDPGVGTFSVKRFYSFLLKKGSELMGLMFGLGLQNNVEDAYSFLMENYNHGDKVYLFGFSRGAHTARRLAAMLDHVGLLLSGSDNMVPYASRMYLEKSDGKDKQTIEGFKKAFCQKCEIHFLGVWDTVSALPFWRHRPKLDGKIASNTKHICHAVAIDEKRLKFPVNLIDSKSIDLNTQTLDQVWFAGVHSDVGGFYKERGLSNIALKWMLSHAYNRGLKLEKSFIEGIEVNSRDQMHNSWTIGWKFIPYHVYFVLFFILLQCGLSKFLGFNLMNWLCLYWKFTSPLAILLLGLMIFLNRQDREIPDSSLVHLTVKDRLQGKVDYAPANLDAAKQAKIEWVEDPHLEG